MPNKKEAHQVTNNKEATLSAHQQGAPSRRRCNAKIFPIKIFPNDKSPTKKLLHNKKKC